MCKQTNTTIGSQCTRLFARNIRYRVDKTSWERLISTMEFPVLGRLHLYLESTPWTFSHLAPSWSSAEHRQLGHSWSPWRTTAPGTRCPDRPGGDGAWSAQTRPLAAEPGEDDCHTSDPGTAGWGQRYSGLWLMHWSLVNVAVILKVQIFEFTIQKYSFSIYRESTLRWTLHNLSNDLSTLVQVMTAPIYYSSRGGPGSMSPYGVTRPKRFGFQLVVVMGSFRWVNARKT